tara:strand:- start:2786 stop:2962 length:177 start_codon:yes stop_codon:yes gene_type:complete
MEINAKTELKRRILLAMYKSVDRANHHWCSGNSSGVIAERFYQENLRSNFESLVEDEK